MMLEAYNILHIVMPDKDIINIRFINYFDQDSGSRCKTGFFVPYDTVTNLTRSLVEKAIYKHRKVLKRPYRPDRKLRR